MSCGLTNQDTTITDADRDFLKKWETLLRKMFKLGELFSFESSVSLNKSDLVFIDNSNHSIPYVTRTINNIDR